MIMNGPMAVREAGSSPTALACGALASYGGNKTVAPENGLYTPEREAHWSQTASESPACIFNPTSTADVAEAVRILGRTGSKYAVRTGGHSPLAGFANIDDGVLISLSGLRDMTYDEQAQTLRTGFGNRWGELYEYLQPHERMVVGGRVSDVGQALTIGGMEVARTNPVLD